MIWAVLAIIALALLAREVWQLLPHAGPAVYGLPELDQVMLWSSVLPRAAVTLVAGAALGLSGLLMQRILRNPLAEPSTLGVSAGAQLTLTAATVYAPFLLEVSREGVALVGGLGAVALILALTWRRGLEPVAVVLAGMMVALTATATSAALILANGEYMTSLFIWGGGSLVQQDWAPAITIATRLAVVGAISVLLLRPLTLLGFGDAGALSLGLSPGTIRLFGIVIAVVLATTVVSEVGVIGFAGLAAPALATLSGARTIRQSLLAAPLIGAILLLLTDGLVQLLSIATRVPTGAATALLGAPLLLWLLPRMRLFEWPSLHASNSEIRRAARPWLIIAALALAATLVALLALSLGRVPGGWQIADGALLADLSALRAPRIVIAVAAGGMLTAAGVIIQRVTGNPLASPEILGAGTGAGVGLAIALLLFGTGSLTGQIVASACGAIGVLAIILALSRRHNFGPERLLFAGIAMSALCSSVLTAVISTGNAEAFALLRWLSGSINDADADQAWIALIAAMLLMAPLFLATRWLQILPLGSATAGGLGLAVAATRMWLILAAGLLTAMAALFVGPLSFIGLIAPHLARLLGLGTVRQHLCGAIAIGATLMVLSDWLARVVAFPYQLPLGLFASMLGGLYLIWLLGHGRERHG